VIRQLGHREADPTAPDLYRGDLPGWDSRLPQPLEVVVILEERALEYLVQKADPIQYIPWRDPEGSVEPPVLYTRLLEDDGTRDRSWHTEVVDVSLNNPAVVRNDGHVITVRQTQPDVHVDGEACALIDDNDLLAVAWERREASA